MLPISGEVPNPDSAKSLIRCLGSIWTWRNFTDNLESGLEFKSSQLSCCLMSKIKYVLVSALIGSCSRTPGLANYLWLHNNSNLWEHHEAAMHPQKFNRQQVWVNPYETIRVLCQVQISTVAAVWCPVVGNGLFELLLISLANRLDHTKESHWWISYS